MRLSAYQKKSAFSRAKTSSVLRRIVARHFGDTFAYREKRGFAIPMQSWMQAAARDDRHDLLKTPMMRSGLLAPAAVSRLLADVGSDYSRWHSLDRSEELFALLVFSAWWERYLS